MSGIVLPAEYGFVGAAIVSTAWLTLWQTAKVGQARKLAKIDYPQLYAEKAEAQTSLVAQKFNCTQRAHQNTLETLTNVVAGTAFMGLQYPRIAAGACAVWVLGRVAYTIGYSTGKPQSRRSGTVPSAIASLVLLLGSSWTAVQFVKAAL